MTIVSFFFPFFLCLSTNLTLFLFFFFSSSFPFCFLLLSYGLLCDLLLSSSLPLFHRLAPLQHRCHPLNNCFDTNRKTIFVGGLNTGLLALSQFQLSLLSLPLWTMRSTHTKELSYGIRTGTNLQGAHRGVLWPLGSVIDVMQAMALSICSLSSKVIFLYLF